MLPGSYNRMATTSSRRKAPHVATAPAAKATAGAGCRTAGPCKPRTQRNTPRALAPLLLLFCFLLPKADKQCAAMVWKWPIRHDSCPTAARSNVPSFAPTLTYCLIKCQCSANFFVYYILLIITLYLD